MKENVSESLAHSESRRLWLVRHSSRVAYWTMSDIARRLAEKLTAAVYVAAAVRRHAGEEHFHYNRVVAFRSPSLDSLLALIDSGDAMVELRMSLHAEDRIRNHGTCFRVKSDGLPRLFQESRQLRG